MSFSELRWSRSHVELAMDIAMSLSDLAQTPESAQRIPAFLGQALDLETLTLAIIADEAAGPSLQFHASAGPVEIGSEFTQNLLAIFQQTRPLAPTDGPTLRHGFDHDGPADLSVERSGQFPRATVLARTLDEKHHMLLVLHQHGDDAALSAGLVDLLQLIADKLARLMAAQITWQSQKQVSEPFSRLTQREWMVLQGLTTDVGEKQLADTLGLSPHTLHSHIKSIYRKVGVQGRLALVGQANRARQEGRISQIANTKRALATPAQNTPAVAVG